MAERKKKPLWVKDVGGGTFRLENGYRVKPGERFRAEESEIPSGAKDLVHLVNPEDANKTQQQKAEQEMPKTSGEFYIKHRGGPWYDVFSPEGVQMNDKANRQEDAEKMRDELNNAE